MIYSSHINGESKGGTGILSIYRVLITINTYWCPLGYPPYAGLLGNSVTPAFYLNSFLLPVWA